MGRGASFATVAIASIAFSPDGATIVYVAAPEDFAFGI